MTATDPAIKLSVSNTAVMPSKKGSFFSDCLI